jgi:Cu-Zn family superoxide dismutase
MLKIIKNLLIFICIIGFTSCYADTVTMYLTTPQGQGKSVGTIQITETKYGLLFTPNLKGMSPGIHGFHVHVNPDCSNNGMAAGGHLDPNATNKHLGPYNDKGHLGDLPAIYILSDGTATQPVLAPRLKHISQIKNHSLMLHSGGDNYSDSPKPLGGGETRMVCGIIH